MDAHDEIELQALDMIERHGPLASDIALQAAQIAAEAALGDELSPETWREIANTIERLTVKA
jgi:hypothetical protein